MDRCSSGTTTPRPVHPGAARCPRQRDARRTHRGHRSRRRKPNRRRGALRRSPPRTARPAPACRAARTSRCNKRTARRHSGVPVRHSRHRPSTAREWPLRRHCALDGAEHVAFKARAPVGKSIVFTADETHRRHHFPVASDDFAMIVFSLFMVRAYATPLLICTIVS